MAEYIEREAVIEALASLARRSFSLSDNFLPYLEGINDADIRIKAIPAADVAPVVRCKDCKFGVRLVVGLDGHEGIMCCHGNISHALEWFCADGAKMEETE